MKIHKLLVVLDKITDKVLQLAAWILKLRFWCWRLKRIRLHRDDTESRGPFPTYKRVDMGLAKAPIVRL